MIGTFFFCLTAVWGATTERPLKDASFIPQWKPQAQFATTTPGWGTEISAGLINLTDQELPFLNQGFNATTDEDTYRAAGRSWFINIKHSF